MYVWISHELLRLLQESVIVTDLIAQSFIKIFNNAFLNTIEHWQQQILQISFPDFF